MGPYLISGSQRDQGSAHKLLTYTSGISDLPMYAYIFILLFGSNIPLFLLLLLFPSQTRPPDRLLQGGSMLPRDFQSNADSWWAAWKLLYVLSLRGIAWISSVKAGILDRSIDPVSVRRTPLDYWHDTRSIIHARSSARARGSFLRPVSVRLRNAWGYL